MNRRNKGKRKTNEKQQTKLTESRKHHKTKQEITNTMGLQLHDVSGVTGGYHWLKAMQRRHSNKMSRPNLNTSIPGGNEELGRKGSGPLLTEL
ncbi:hypothetical protein V6N12_047652 [Hibiscus sabdariffa]|uniref:Uncharacterized protein n=1 Tax=Hibiscus sabdariffa TaxID=183260 RepID=A0ABR2CTL2_9ROSI